MSDVEAIEQAIADRLTTALADLAGVEVVVLPETQDEHDLPVGDGRVTVAYHSSRFDGDSASVHHQQRAMGFVAQKQLADFQIAIETRKLRGTAGKHAILKATIKALLGWQPTGLGKLYLVEDNYYGFQSNLWCHVVTFRGEGLAVEVGPDADPPLVSLTLNQQ